MVRRCDNCGVSESSTQLFQCSGCKSALYCSRNCQREDRKQHRGACHSSSSRTPAASASSPGGAAMSTVSATSPSFIAFLTHGLDQSYTSQNPVWQRLLTDASIEAAQKLPQAVHQPWQLKVVRYWKKPDKSDLVWTLEVLNTTPMIRDESETHLLMYREPWCPPSDNNAESNGEFVERIVNVLLTAMMEGGNIAARHSISAMTLGTLPSDYFMPRRPGMLGVDEKLSAWFDGIQSRLSSLNMLVAVFNERGMRSSGGDAAFRRLWETEGNTILEPGGSIQIRCLSKQERKEALENGPEMWEDANDYVELYPPPEDLTDSEPRWARDGYTSIEEATEDYGDEAEEMQLEEEVAGWQEQGYNSLEEGCMDYYNARSIEEAVWDYVGVPRLVCLGDRARDKLEDAGWRCEGYKPGRDYEVNDRTIKYRQRVVHEFAGGYVWSEGR